MAKLLTGPNGEPSISHPFGDEGAWITMRLRQHDRVSIEITGPRGGKVFSTWIKAHQGQEIATDLMTLWFAAENGVVMPVQSHVSSGDKEEND